MGLQILIGGTDRTSACNIKSLVITSSITANASVCELEAYSSGFSWRPQAGNQISVTTTSDSTRHFAGIVIDVYETMVNRTDGHYRIMCKDNTWLLDRRMVSKNYASQAGSAIVADIVSVFTTGFSTSQIQASGTVAAQRFDYVYPSDAIRAIAEQLQWHWYVDFTTGRNVRFFSAISDVAPATGINFDTNTANYADLELHESAANIKNRIILQGYQVGSTYQVNRTFVGDSTTYFFLLGYEPTDNTTTNITVTVGSTATPYNVGIDSVDAAPGTTQGTSSSAYVCFTNLGLRFSTGFSAPTSSQNIIANFNYLKPGGIQYDDGAAQTAMAARTSGDGIHMFAISDPNLTNLGSNDDLAIAVGTAVATRYGRPTIVGTFKSYTNGWRAGQYFTGISATRMGSFNKSFYVSAVTKRVVSHPSGGSPTWLHEVSISDTAIPF